MAQDSCANFYILTHLLCVTYANIQLQFSALPALNCNELAVMQNLLRKGLRACKINVIMNYHAVNA